jgi:hypothetical protein
MYLVRFRKQSGRIYKIQVKSFVDCAAHVYDMAYWYILATVDPDFTGFLDYTCEPIKVEGIAADVPQALLVGSSYLDSDKPLLLQSTPKSKNPERSASLAEWPEMARYTLGFRGPDLLKPPKRSVQGEREVLRKMGMYPPPKP